MGDISMEVWGLFLVIIIQVVIVTAVIVTTRTQVTGLRERVETLEGHNISERLAVIERDIKSMLSLMKSK